MKQQEAIDLVKEIREAADIRWASTMTTESADWAVLVVPPHGDSKDGKLYWSRADWLGHRIADGFPARRQESLEAAVKNLKRATDRMDEARRTRYPFDEVRELLNACRRILAAFERLQ